MSFLERDARARTPQANPIDPPVDGAPARQPFTLPAGLLGKFGIVKLWPEIKVAEDEVIARLCNTAAALGLQAVVVDHTGVMIDPPHLQLTQDDLDFVIHLHFGTPKSYDIFSFVVLWNPLQFYHDFTYRRVSRHLLTHDDFLSCGSPAADDQIARMIVHDPARDGPHFTMYHSASEPVLAPTLGDRKLFYSGINWERLGKGASRHQTVLDELDLSGKLRIYGPRVLHKVQVWEGYHSYQGPLPFDGCSVIREINRAGLALVLSSGSHIESELMSNRLFEALAGGAVIICDQNPFARKHFGDTLLYIDTTNPADEIAGKILEHIRWVETNPDAALALARSAQALFERSYRLDISVREIYNGLSARRTHLRQLGAGNGDASQVDLFLLMPQYSAAVLDHHIANALSQKHTSCRIVLVADTFELGYFRARIDAALQASGITIELAAMPFFDRTPRGGRVRQIRLGRIVAQLFAPGAPDRLLCVVAPNERIFSNHLELLAGALSRHPAAGYAYCDAALCYMDGTQKATYEVREQLDLFGFTPNFPIGWGRLLFRAAALGRLATVLLPYLDVAALAGLALYIEGVPSKRATIVIDIEHPFNVGEPVKTAAAGPRSFAERLREEQDIIRDVDPRKFDQAWSGPAAPDTSPRTAVLETEHLAPRSLYLDRLSRKNQQILLAQLIRSLPMPRFVWSMLRPLQPWRRGSKATSKALAADQPAIEP